METQGQESGKRGMRSGRRARELVAEGRQTLSGGAWKGRAPVDD